MPRRVHAATAMTQCTGLQPGNAENSNPHKDVTAWAEPGSGRSLECEPLWRKLPPHCAVVRALATLPPRCGLPHHGHSGDCRQLSRGPGHAPVTHSPTPKTEDSVGSEMRAWSSVERGEEKGGVVGQSRGARDCGVTQRGRNQTRSWTQKHAPAACSFVCDFVCEAAGDEGHPTPACRGARGGRDACGSRTATAVPAAVTPPGRGRLRRRPPQRG